MIQISEKLLTDTLVQLKAAQQDQYVHSTQNVIDELEKAQKLAAEKKDFIRYCTDTRLVFCTQFAKLYPDAKARVIAEDLLIAYDQLLQRVIPSTDFCPSCKTTYNKEEIETNEHCFTCGEDME